jgi:hypothetical protein
MNFLDLIGSHLAHTWALNLSNENLKGSVTNAP